MNKSVPNLPAHRILAVVLALATLLAANAARAQLIPPTPYGDRQSPIDIVNPRPVSSEPKFGDTKELETALTFTVKNTTGKKLCDGEGCGDAKTDQRWGSLKAYPPKGAAPHIWFGGVRYTLDEFHFHAPAEHLVNGQLTQMEVHYVFIKDGGNPCKTGGLLVIGQRIKQGVENEMLDKIYGPQVPLPTNYYADPAIVPGFKIRAVTGDLHAQSSYRYAGSLTAPAELPGCPDPPEPPGNPIQQLQTGYLPESVTWVLLEQPIQMSKEQIARFRKLFPNGDARGPQALHQVVKKAPPGRQP